MSDRVALYLGRGMSRDRHADVLGRGVRRPDNRTNRAYTQTVNRCLAKGRNARAYHWFDVFGSDPSCSKAGFL